MADIDEVEELPSVDQEITTPDEVVEPELAPSDDVTPEEAEGNPEKIAHPAFTPTFKYKVYGQEKELPENVRQLIKTADDEKYFQELYSKADGVEGLKEKREKTQLERDQWASEYQGLASEVQKATGLFKNGQFDEAYQMMQMEKPTIDQVMNGFGFSKDQVIELAAQLYSLTPQEEKLQNQVRQEQLRSRQYEEQVSHFTTQQQQSQQNWVTTQLQATLTSPEISSIAQAFDQRLNSPGAFENEIRQLGTAYYQSTNQIIPPDQLAKSFIQKYGLQAPTPAPSQQPQQVLTNVGVKKEVPVIASVDGSIGSPGQKQLKTYDDLMSEIKKLK